MRRPRVRLTGIGTNIGSSVVTVTKIIKPIGIIFIIIIITIIKIVRSRMEWLYDRISSRLVFE